MPDSDASESLVAIHMTLDELLDLQWWLGLDGNTMDQYAAPDVVQQIRVMDHVALVNNIWE